MGGRKNGTQELYLPQLCLAFICSQIEPRTEKKKEIEHKIFILLLPTQTALKERFLSAMPVSCVPKHSLIIGVSLLSVFILWIQEPSYFRIHGSIVPSIVFGIFLFLIFSMIDLEKHNLELILIYPKPLLFFSSPTKENPVFLSQHIYLS